MLKNFAYHSKEYGESHACCSYLKTFHNFLYLFIFNYTQLVNKGDASGGTFLLNFPRFVSADTSVNTMELLIK